MRDAKKNWALKTSTFVVVTACFAVMSSALLVSQNINNFLTLWGEDVQMTVYLSPDISEKNYQFIEKKLHDSGKTNAIQRVTQEKALHDFRLQLASYAPDLAQDQELLKLIPASIQVSLSKAVPLSEQLQTLQWLAADVKKIEGVDEVSYGQEWISKYSALIMTFEVVLGILGVIILASALFVISNAIRASIQNRKDEIVVLEMIGATSTMIRKPFLIEGAILGAGSSALAVLLCFFIHTGIKNLLVTKLDFLRIGEHLQFISSGTLVVFVIGGTFLGIIASFLCVRSINDGYAGRQG